MVVEGGGGGWGAGINLVFSARLMLSIPLPEKIRLPTKKVPDTKGSKSFIGGPHFLSSRRGVRVMLQVSQP